MWSVTMTYITTLWQVWPSCIISYHTSLSKFEIKNRKENQKEKRTKSIVYNSDKKLATLYYNSSLRVKTRKEPCIRFNIRKLSRVPNTIFIMITIIYISCFIDVCLMLNICWGLFHLWLIFNCILYYPHVLSVSTLYSSKSFIIFFC